MNGNDFIEYAEAHDMEVKDVTAEQIQNWDDDAYDRWKDEQRERKEEEERISCKEQPYIG